jgi:adenylate cyclase
MTVMFADVRGFTAISEQLSPPELTQFMCELMTPMTRLVHEHRGTIDKYMGDAIMAFWGAPLADPEHASHALSAALAMIGSLEHLQQQSQAKNWPPIKIGIGLNSGDMTVGNMGSKFRMAYTVMGDAVNLGARLQELTKEYGVAIIVGESTKNQATDFVFRELDYVQVRGKEKPVAIFEPVCALNEEGPAMRDELRLYREALRFYRAQNWDLAELQLLSLQKLYPQRYLYQMYLNRISHFRRHAPAQDWNGTFPCSTNQQGTHT